jgi:tight adherence protein C
MSQIDRYLPFGLTADSALIGMVAAVAFLTVMAVWYGLIERDPLANRARMLAARREELRRSQAAAAPRRRRQESLSLMRQVVAAVKLLQTQQTAKLSDRLAQSGARSRDALIVFMFFKLTLPVAFGVVAVFVLYVLHMGSMPGAVRPLLVALALGAGWFTPELYVKNRIVKRHLALQRALPDGLDLLVICAEAGLSLDAALDRVSQEIGPSSPELAEELALTSVELGFLPERRQALLNLNRRTDLAPIRGVVNTLLQTEKYGTPLSQSLRVLSSEFREQRLLKAEEKAARLPATLTVPMIVFILPTLFIVLVGSAIISVMDNLSRS